MTFVRIVSTIGYGAANLLVRRYLTEQVGQRRRIADPAARDLNGAYLQRFLIDPNVYLAPQSAFDADTGC